MTNDHTRVSDGADRWEIINARRFYINSEALSAYECCVITSILDRVELSARRSGEFVAINAEADTKRVKHFATSECVAILVEDYFCLSGGEAVQ